MLRRMCVRVPCDTQQKYQHTYTHTYQNRRGLGYVCVGVFARAWPCPPSMTRLRARSQICLLCSQWGAQINFYKFLRGISFAVLVVLKCQHSQSQTLFRVHPTTVSRRAQGVGPLAYLFIHSLRSLATRVCLFAIFCAKGYARVRWTQKTQKQPEAAEPAAADFK